MPSSITAVTNLISALLSSSVGLLVYVFTAYALYKMAKACGVEKPWKAYLPVLNAVLVGRIADVHCARNEGRRTSYAKILLWMQIVLLILGALAFVLLVVLAIASMASIIADLLQDTVPDSIIATMFTMLPVFLAILAVSVVLLVFYYIALHKIFRLYDPEDATMYLVLCILLSISVPIVLMFLARKQPIFSDIPEQTDPEPSHAFTSDYSL